MSNGFGILMIIFGIVTTIYVFLIYRGHSSLLPMTYHGKKTKSYLNYLGKSIMIVSISPIITGIVSLLIDIDKYFYIVFILLILSFILLLVLVVMRIK